MDIETLSWKFGQRLARSKLPSCAELLFGHVGPSTMLHVTTGYSESDEHHVHEFLTLYYANFFGFSIGEKARGFGLAF